MKKSLRTVFFLTTMSTPILADNYYVYGNIAQSKFSIEESHSALISAHFPDQSTFWSKQKDSSFALGFGYRLNDVVSLELGYSDLGNTVRTSKWSGDSYVSKTSTDWSALQISVVTIFPMTNNINLYSRVGGAKIRKEWSYKTQGIDYAGQPDNYNDFGSDSINAFILGAGLGYKINDRITLRTEYVRYGWEFSPVSSVSIGAAYSF